MPPMPEDRAPRCGLRWIGGSVVLLGGASLGVSGFDTPLAVLVRLGIAALIGAVLALLLCPARTGKRDDGAGADGSGADTPGDGRRHGRCRDNDSGDGGDGDGGSDGGSDGGGDGGGGDGGGGE